jgi:hypothetical protein
MPPPPPGVDWWRTGVIPPAGTYDNYWTDPYTLFAIEVVLIQFAELKRLQDFRYPGSQGKQYFLGIEKVGGCESGCVRKGVCASGRERLDGCSGQEHVKRLCQWINIWHVL